MLTVLSWLYGLIGWIRNRCFDLGILPSRSLPGVVISVGNIASGGTGKSPVVVSLARRIQASGGRPAVVTRGYRGGLRSGQWQVVENGKVILGNAPRAAVADEARMQSMALPDVPVIVGSRRWEAVQGYLAAITGPAPTHFILDDGFQHRSIRRDLDYVLLDGRNPFGDLLPKGLFREGIAALRRASGVVITKSVEQRQVDEVRRRLRDVSLSLPVWEAKMSVSDPVRVCGEDFPGSVRWCAIAGIAIPGDFVASLKSRNIIAQVQFFSGDHKSFDAPKVMAARSRFDAVITTSKDWARDEAEFRGLGCPVFVLPVEVEWTAGAPELV
jgi:tetraacyldisaccharide 4'-kinase